MSLGGVSIEEEEKEKEEEGGKVSCSYRRSRRGKDVSYYESMRQRRAARV